MLAIKISREKTTLRTVRLAPEVTYIGRMPENHIVIDDPQASRSHARIFRKDDQFVIEDQQSENGIFVNGTKTSVHTLAEGDKIGIGSYVLEVVTASEEAKPATRKLEDADEEWRMDQTISTTTEKLEAHLKSVKAGPSAPSATSKLPTMNFTLKIGDATYTENIVFDKARKRLPEDGKENIVEVRVRIGKWILDKKIPI